MSNVDKIIRRLEADANEIAQDVLKLQADVEREEALARMEVIIGELAAEITARDDAAELNALGVRIKETHDGALWFMKGHKKLALRPRDNLSVKIGQATVYPNRDNPVFDDRFYDDIMERVFKWAEKK